MSDNNSDNKILDSDDEINTFNNSNTIYQSNPINHSDNNNSSNNSDDKQTDKINDNINKSNSDNFLLKG